MSHGRDANSNIAPRKIGSSASRLMDNILKRHKDVNLTQREKDTVRLWIDSGAPYPATYAALGTGMVPFRPDKDVFKRLCLACHAPRDEKKPKWTTGFKTHADLLVNLTHPERSLILRAPLARSAGGLGLCGKKLTFDTTESPDYQKLLNGVRTIKQWLDTARRFDMDGFRPNKHYVREMRRYGILPPPQDGADETIDVYATDRAYWRSFWYVP
ncbi:MAG: hypothetical protein HN742_24225 [Lentisphaerae bacterium]|nr:hypothetical protein [Lentisphaerota bacterium]MBT4820752.1 hypothetical protein [Lentisphaerota bacterium]MBT5611887.1 hypothetical protein [Lentisphaerota bacterium]MBT7845006.1 hypothetical protein [Lentisphaerota bacterium]